MSMRRKTYTGTVAISTTDTITIPDNVRVTTITINQAGASHKFYPEAASTLERTQAIPNHNVGSDYIYYVNFMGSVTIANLSGANIVAYTIAAEEILS